MMIILPFACYAILVAIFRSRKIEWRLALLYATIPWAVFLAVSTETLSAFRLISRPGLSAAWLAACLSALAVWKKAGSTPARPLQADGLPSWADVRRQTGGKIMLSVIAIILIVVAFTALLSAPNTWDAIVYHLPRVVEWTTYRSVAFFPTVDTQQLSMPPWTEYVMLHTDLLYKGDRFVNLIQWFAFGGCILGASVLAKQLGAGPFIQLFAAVLCATIPQGILAASGPKNDYVLSFWITLCVILLLEWKSRQTWPVLLGISSALALAVFTKGTAYTFLPFIVLACFFTWKFPAQKAFLFKLPIVLMVVLIINGPLWSRNYQFSGSILGPSAPDGVGDSSKRTFGIQNLSPREGIANVARNAAIHLGTPSKRLNVVLQHVVEKAISAIGVDPNDPSHIAIGKSGRSFLFYIPFTRQEVLCGNLTHFLLFLLALGVLCFHPRFNRDALLLSCGIIGAFVLFSVLIRWMPQNGRFHLPLFVLAAAISAVALPKIMSEKAAVWITVILFAVAIPLLVGNYCRPLFKSDSSILRSPRDETYFFDTRQDLEESYMNVAASVRAGKCRQLGLDANDDRFEYAFMALANEDGGGSRAIQYVGVHNKTVAYARADQPPVCTVICFNCRTDLAKWDEYRYLGSRASVYGNVVVFGPEEKSQY